MAIELAERSAADGRVADGLDDAIMESLVTAGAAISPAYGVSVDDEPGPRGESACVVASLAAKAAEWTAKAARNDAADSAHAALEAYTFARDAAHTAEAPGVLVQLQNDFAALYRVASRGRWSDHTPVPPSVFDLLGVDTSEKAWWKFRR